MGRNELDPWRVIRSFLSKVVTYKVPDLVDSAGLSVDWTITQRENSSHTLRWTAYRPKIDAAYEALKNEDDRLRVTFIIARELSKEGFADEMQRALKEIGWELKDDRLIPASRDVRELFFPDQTQHDAYVEIRTILQQARKSVLLVDPYIDESILTLLGTRASVGMEFQILSAKLPSDFELEAKKWISQHKVKLQVRKTRDFHDRFLLLDGSRCWHIGCSIKDAGNRAFMLSQVEDEANRTPLVGKIVDAWESGTPVL